MSKSEFFDQIVAAAAKSGGKKPCMADSKAWLAFLSDAPVLHRAASENTPEAEESAVSSEPAGAVAPACPVTAGDLGVLQEAALGCRKCVLCEKRNHVVFGEGDPHAELMFIGEGPGFDEDRTGRPFVGKAGQLLDKMILAMQFAREEVYICNIVKCRPPDNRAPMPEEAQACLPYLKEQIRLVSPKVIVLLGATAAHYLLDQKEGITRLRGKWLEYEGIPVMPTYHPAFLLRQAAAKREAWLDLQQVMAKFNKYHNRH